MTKPNWRDASKELPEKVNDCYYECLIVVQSIVDNKLHKYITTAFFTVDPVYGFLWDSINSDEMVLKWLPINEIPLPEDIL